MKYKLLFTTTMTCMYLATYKHKSQPEGVNMYDLESEWPAHYQGKTPG